MGVLADSSARAALLASEPSSESFLLFFPGNMLADKDSNGVFCLVGFRKFKSFLSFHPVSVHNDSISVEMTNWTHDHVPNLFTKRLSSQILVLSSEDTIWTDYFFKP